MSIKINKTTPQNSIQSQQERLKDVKFEQEKGEEMLVDNVANRSIVQVPETSKNNQEESYANKVMSTIVTKELYKDPEIISFVRKYQARYNMMNENSPDKNVKDKFLYNILSNPKWIKENPYLLETVYSLVKTERDADLFAREDVLDFINNESDKKTFSIYRNMEDNSYSMQVFKNGKKSGITFHISEDGVSTDSRSIRRGYFQEKKENSDGTYVVAKKNHSKNYKTVYDNDGIPLYSEVLKQDNNSHYEVTRYERGLNKSMEKSEIAANTMNTEGEIVERNFESAQGITTNYKSINNGNMSSLEYSITDENGNILSSINRSHQIIDENHTTSQLNGDKYDVEFSDSITVTKTNKFGEKETVVLDSTQLDFDLKDLYRNLTGDVLFGLKKIWNKNILYR